MGKPIAFGQIAGMKKTSKVSETFEVYRQLG
jgi:hypothetical protein